MKLSHATLLSLAAAMVAAAPVATVTVHEHQRHTVVVEGYVYADDFTTHTGYRTLTEDQGNPVQATEAVQESQVQAPETENTVQPTQTAEQPTEATQAPATQTQATQTQATQTQATQTQATPEANSKSNSDLSSFASDMLDAHNKKRALHKDTPALSWSDELASYAQNYANGYDCSGSLSHSGGPYGENLAVGYSGADAVNAWYNEIDQYDFSNGGFSSATGHFTQVVWKSTTEVGCASKACGGAWGDYIICSYNPAGNMLGTFQENVEPLA